MCRMSGVLNIKVWVQKVCFVLFHKCAAIDNVFLSKESFEICGMLDDVYLATKKKGNLYGHVYRFFFGLLMLEMWINFQYIWMMFGSDIFECGQKWPVLIILKGWTRGGSYDDVSEWECWRIEGGWGRKKREWGRMLGEEGVQMSLRSGDVGASSSSWTWCGDGILSWGTCLGTWTIGSRSFLNLPLSMLLAFLCGKLVSLFGTRETLHHALIRLQCPNQNLARFSLATLFKSFAIILPAFMSSVSNNFSYIYPDNQFDSEAFPQFSKLETKYAPQAFASGFISFCKIS